MNNKSTILSYVIIIAIGSTALGYKLGYHASERSIKSNICMARYADVHGEFAWMYIGDDRCPLHQRTAAKLLIFE